MISNQVESDEEISSMAVNTSKNGGRIFFQTDNKAVSLFRISICMEIFPFIIIDTVARLDLKSYEVFSQAPKLLESDQKGRRLLFR